MLIGLTGGMGCGKSTVLKMFAELGCPTFSSDAEVARLLGTARIQAEIKRIFGPDALNGEGRVAKADLAQRVFTSPEELQKLEDLLHPRVLEALDYFGKVHAMRICVAEVPLLFEKNLEHLFAKTVCVLCTPETALARYAQEKGVPLEEARMRTAFQLPMEEKKRRADFVIDSEHHPDVVKRQVEVLYRRFCLLPQK